MSLSITTQGSGPDIVLLHGWGLAAAVWEDTAQALAQHFRVTLIDLPGYGQSPVTDDYSLPALARQVAQVAPSPALWVGWSLGGMVAMQLAIQQPHAVCALVLAASTARFVQGADWPHAVEAHVLDTFALDLALNYRRTVQRFLALQARGSERGLAVIRRLSARLPAHGEPAVVALQAGLGILRNADLRAQLKDINCPTLLIAGEHDTLIPLDAAKALVVMFQQGRLHTMQGAGHALFLSHAQEFVQLICEFSYGTCNGDSRSEPPSIGQESITPDL